MMKFYHQHVFFNKIFLIKYLSNLLKNHYHTTCFPFPFPAYVLATSAFKGTSLCPKVKYNIYLRAKSALR